MQRPPFVSQSWPKEVKDHEATKKSSLAYFNTSSILEERRSRQKVENDRARLLNRVRQLEKEEEKMAKKIAETKSRVQDVLESKRRNEKAAREKEERAIRERQKINQQREGNMRLKNHIRQAKEEMECRILESKISVAKRTKEEKKEISRMLARERLLARKKAMEKKEAVKKSEIESRMKIQQHKSELLQMAQQDYESRLQKEIRSRQEKERELMQLVQLESEIIERLQTKQKEKVKVEHVLDKALSIKPMESLISSQEVNGRNIEESGLDYKKIFDIFEKYDIDKKGYVEIGNLKAVLTEIGFMMDDMQWMRARQEVDPDLSRKFTIEQLLTYLNEHMS